MSFFSKDLDMACLECSTQTLFISRQHRIEYCEEHRHLMNKDTFEWKSQRFFNNRKRIEEYYNQDLIDVKNTETTNISELKINSTIFNNEIMLINLIKNIESYVESEVNIGVYDSLYSGELIQSISLTNDNDNWTITRFCTKNNVVVNGLSKLLAEFQKEFKNIKSISYISNRRYDYISLTDMNFIPVYTEPNILYIRPDLINKKSDHIIYDSGNIIWTKFL